MNPMRKLILAFLVCSIVATGQVPSIIGAMDESNPKELQAKLWWNKVPNATSYNIYIAQGLHVNTCPTYDAIIAVSQCWPTSATTCSYKNHEVGQPAWFLDTNTTNNWYLDDPTPGWGEATPVGSHHMIHWWCYAVAAVVGGKEQPKTTPQFISIGWTGYMALSYKDVCTGYSIPFLYTTEESHFTLYYRSSDGINHPIPYIGPILGNNIMEIWIKFPAESSDGTYAPFEDQAGNHVLYYVEWSLPDGHHGAEALMPAGGDGSDRYYYSQVGRSLIPGSGNIICPDATTQFVNQWSQNVSR